MWCIISLFSLQLQWHQECTTIYRHVLVPFLSSVSPALLDPQFYFNHHLIIHSFSHSPTHSFTQFIFILCCSFVSSLHESAELTLLSSDSQFNLSGTCLFFASYFKQNNIMSFMNQKTNEPICHFLQEWITFFGFNQYWEITTCK